MPPSGCEVKSGWRISPKMVASLGAASPQTQQQLIKHSVVQKGLVESAYVSCSIVAGCNDRRAAE
jgi:hypothetical protein